MVKCPLYMRKTWGSRDKYASIKQHALHLYISKNQQHIQKVNPFRKIYCLKKKNNFMEFH